LHASSFVIERRFIVKIGRHRWCSNCLHLIRILRQWRVLYDGCGNEQGRSVTNQRDECLLCELGSSQSQGNVVFWICWVCIEPETTNRQRVLW
jgi:hypothetical protein